MTVRRGAVTAYRRVTRGADGGSDPPAARPLASAAIPARHIAGLKRAVISAPSSHVHAKGVPVDVEGCGGRAAGMLFQPVRWYGYRGRGGRPNVRRAQGPP